MPNKLSSFLSEKINLDHDFVSDCVVEVSGVLNKKNINDTESCAVLMATYINIDEDIFKGALEQFCQAEQISIHEAFDLN